MRNVSQFGWFSTMSLFFGCAAFAQQPSACPIEFQKVDPNSNPLTAGLLAQGDHDPWDHYLRIEYKNISNKTVIAIRFGVAFVDALADVNRSMFAYDSTEIVKPGKTAKPYWGDGAYFHQYGYRMQAIVWLEKARFSDNTFFNDNGSHACGFPAVVNQAIGSAVAPASSVNRPVEQPLKSAAQANTPSASTDGPGGELRISAEEIARLVKVGAASQCSVITNPPGAEIDIDGKTVGKSPMVFVLLKRGETPRIITLKLPGYKAIVKKTIPDGSMIPLTLTLEKDDAGLVR